MKWLSLLNNNSHDEKEDIAILSQYKCKMNHLKCHIVLDTDCLLIKDKYTKHHILCKDIKSINLVEKMWSIRVQVSCKGKNYDFDFPSFKIATNFYEYLIYSKVKGQLE